MADCFDDEHWLFAYECFHRGWHAGEVATAGINAAHGPAFLHRLGVTFVDEDIIGTYQPPMPHWPTGGGGGDGDY